MHLEYILCAFAFNFAQNVKKTLRMYTIFVKWCNYCFVFLEQHRLSKI